MHYPRANDCKACSKSASDARALRAQTIMPLMIDSAMDCWKHGSIIVCRGWHHETIELVLMFLRGRLTLVLRPLPSIDDLVKHGFPKIHPRFAEWLRPIHSNRCVAISMIYRVLGRSAYLTVRLTRQDSAQRVVSNRRSCTTVHACLAVVT